MLLLRLFHKMPADASEQFVSVEIFIFLNSAIISLSSKFMTVTNYQREIIVLIHEHVALIGILFYALYT